jgi:hypothetical protein
VLLLLVIARELFFVASAQTKEPLKVLPKRRARRGVQNEINGMIGVVNEHEQRVGERIVRLVHFLHVKCDIERGWRFQYHKPEAHRNEHYRQGCSLCFSLASLMRGARRGETSIGKLHDFANDEQIHDKQNATWYDYEEEKVQLGVEVNAELIVLGMVVFRYGTVVDELVIFLLTARVGF